MSETNGRSMRVSIAVKIFSIALTLLILLAVAAAFSTRNVARVSAEVEAIGVYFTPLAQLASRAQIKQLQQARVLERVLRRHAEVARADNSVADGESELAQLGREIDDELARGLQLAADGLAAAADEAARIEFSTLRPTIERVSKEHQDYEDLARDILRSRDAGELTRAATLTEMLVKEERDLLAALDTLRTSLQNFSRRSLEEAAAHEAEILRLNLLITIAAAISGLLFASLVTSGLMRPIRRLVAGTQAVERGQLDTEVPVTSRDEIGALTQSFNAMVGELRVKERIKDTFGKYVDPRIVQSLLDQPDIATAAGERRLVTVFFSDIEGFTSIGESLTPGGLVTVINEYFTVMSEPITRHGGIIDKYIGDAIMAFWAPPFVPSGEQASRACLAALDQLALLPDYQQALPDLMGVRQGVPQVRMRIGIATGEVVIGNIGSQKVKGYTVMGDAVNLASRLEGAAKQYGVRMLISERTVEMVRGDIDTREVDAIRVTGKTEPARVFEILGRKGTLPAARVELRDTFEEALAAYRAGRWDAAEQGFRHCLALDPADAPSRLFCERIAAFRVTPPPADWDGVWTMGHK